MSAPQERISFPIAHSSSALTIQNGTLKQSGNMWFERMNVAAATSVDLIEIAAGKTVNACVGSNRESKSAVTGTALLAGSSTLNASLTLADGATLDMMSLLALTALAMRRRRK